jgi:hypothetical protein
MRAKIIILAINETHVCVSICLFVHLIVCLSVCLSTIQIFSKTLIPLYMYFRLYILKLQAFYTINIMKR